VSHYPQIPDTQPSSDFTEGDVVRDTQYAISIPSSSHEPNTRSTPRVSLSIKLFAALLLVALVGVVVVALLAGQAAERELTHFMLRGQVIAPDELLNQLAAYYRQQNSWAGIQQRLELTEPGGMGRGMMGRGMMGQRMSDRLIIADDQGRVVADTAERRLGDRLSSAEQADGWPVKSAGETIGTLVVVESEPFMPGMMQTRLSPEGEATLQRVQQAILVAGLAAGAVALVLASLLAWRLVRPLRRLTSAAEAVAEGDLSQRVAVRSGDELGDLAAAFNHMASELQRAEQLRRDLTADVAHELRTPLSVIRSHVEALQDGVFSLTTESLDPIYDKTLLLSRLVEDLRELALAEAGQLPLVRTRVDLVRLLQQTLDSFKAQTEQKQVTVQAEISPHLPHILADRERLTQVLSNLFSNALQHTPSGGTITIWAMQDSDYANVSLADTGTGISPQDLPRIFERFYRSDRARGRPTDSQGTGLGLAIAKSIVEAHGGTVQVESQLGRGSVFTIRLPLNKKQ
jgi:signal transduction histidine kinase